MADLLVVCDDPRKPLRADKPLKVVIAGGGIAGLVSALELAKIGADITIYEQMNVCGGSQLGLSMQVMPMASEILHELGLGEQIAATAVQISKQTLGTNLGAHMWTEPRGLEGERIGLDKLHLGYKLIKVEDSPSASTASAVFTHGQTRETIQVEADVVIGADGLHSNTRKTFHRDEKIYTGWIIWRGLVELDCVPFDGRTLTLLGGIQEPATGKILPENDVRFVFMPINSVMPKQHGRSLFGWALEVKDPVDPSGNEQWESRGSLEELLPIIGDWQYGGIRMADLVKGTQEQGRLIRKWPLYDREPCESFAYGRICLVGDSAHPMLPFGGLGGTQAMLDARCLREALQQCENVDQALKRYSEARAPIVGKIIHSMRAGADFGPFGIVCQNCSGEIPDEMLRKRLELGGDLHGMMQKGRDNFKQVAWKRIGDSKL